MKKFLVAVLALMMVLSLAACGGDTQDASTPDVEAEDQIDGDVEDNDLPEEAPVEVSPEADTDEADEDASTEDTDADADDSAAFADLTDGTFTGSAMGNNGNVTVEVVVEGGAVTSVEVTEHAETAGLADPAIEQTPAAIVEAQSTAVDSVSGATNTSKAIMKAVENALAAE